MSAGTGRTPWDKWTGKGVLTNWANVRLSTAYAFSKYPLRVNPHFDDHPRERILIDRDLPTAFPPADGQGRLLRESEIGVEGVQLGIPTAPRLEYQMPPLANHPWRHAGGDPTTAQSCPCAGTATAFLPVRGPRTPIAGGLGTQDLMR